MSLPRGKEMSLSTNLPRTSGIGVMLLAHLSLDMSSTAQEAAHSPRYLKTSNVFSKGGPKFSAESQPSHPSLFTGRG